MGLVACGGIPAVQGSHAAAGTPSPSSALAPSVMPSVNATQAAAACAPVAAGQGAVGFQPLALTFVSPVEGWVLGTNASIPGSCVLLYRTTDGGASWSRVPGPPATYPTDGCSANPLISCVDRVLFATPQRGFVFGADWGVVYATTDGGHDWSRLNITDVSAMALAREVALRLSGTEGAPRACASWSAATTEV